MRLFGSSFVHHTTLCGPCLWQGLQIVRRGRDNRLKIGWYLCNHTSGSSLALGNTALGENLLFSLSLSIVFCKTNNITAEGNIHAHISKGSALRWRTFHTAMQPTTLPTAAWKRHSSNPESIKKKKAPVNVFPNDLYKSGKIWKVELFNQNIHYRAGSRRYDRITPSNTKKIKIFFTLFSLLLEVSLRVQTVKEVNILSSKKDEVIFNQ